MAKEKSAKKRDIGAAVGIGVLVLTAFVLNIVLKKPLGVSILVASVLGILAGFITEKLQSG